jgi:hypothetical protein
MLSALGLPAVLWLSLCRSLKGSFSSALGGGGDADSCGGTGRARRAGAAGSGDAFRFDELICGDGDRDFVGDLGGVWSAVVRE